MSTDNTIVTPKARGPTISTLIAKLVLKDTIYNQLRPWAQKYAETKAPNTVRAMRHDLELWVRYTIEVGEQAFPAQPETIAGFIAWLKPDHKLSSIRRTLSMLKKLHVEALEVAPPTEHYIVRAALDKEQRIINKRLRDGHRPTLKAGEGQREGLRKEVIDAYLITVDEDNIIDVRDRALVTLMHDAMLRREEVVRVVVQDIGWEEKDDIISLNIPVSKGDQEAEGKLTYITRQTLDYLIDWREQSGVSEGFLLRGLYKGGRVRENAMAESSIPQLLKQIAARGGMSPEGVERISGHSPRIGMAQDFKAAGVQDSKAVSHGRWANMNMYLLYTRKMAGGDSAIAEYQNKLTSGGE